MTKEVSKPDYSLNIPYLIRQFQEATTIIENDRETLKTPGIMGWKIRQQTLAIFLLAAGHSVNYKTGKVEYVRKK